jgi:hypothetical protein
MELDKLEKLIETAQAERDRAQIRLSALVDARTALTGESPKIERHEDGVKRPGKKHPFQSSPARQQQIINYLRKVDAGQTIREILSEVDFKQTTLAQELRIMEREGRLRVRQSPTNRTKYYSVPTANTDAVVQ